MNTIGYRLLAGADAIKDMTVNDFLVNVKDPDNNVLYQPYTRNVTNYEMLCTVGDFKKRSYNACKEFRKNNPSYSTPTTLSLLDLTDETAKDYVVVRGVEHEGIKEPYWRNSIDVGATIYIPTDGETGLETHAWEITEVHTEFVEAKSYLSKTACFIGDYNVKWFDNETMCHKACESGGILEQPAITVNQVESDKEAAVHRAIDVIYKAALDDIDRLVSLVPESAFNDELVLQNAVLIAMTRRR